MRDASKPMENTRDGDSVTRPVAEPAAETEEDLKALLEKAEAEAREAQVAAEAARARVRDMRSAQGEKPGMLERFRRPTWAVVAKAGAALVVLAALTLSVLIVVSHQKAADRRERAEQFTAAAKEGVVALTSLDFNHARENVQRIIDKATGSYKDDFVARADDFIKVVEMSKVSTKGTVTATAVEKVTDDSADVLVVAHEEVTNSAGAKNDPRVFRMAVTVSRDGGDLKLSKVELVP